MTRKELPAAMPREIASRSPGLSFAGATRRWLAVRGESPSVPHVDPWCRLACLISPPELLALLVRNYCGTSQPHTEHILRSTEVFR